MHSKTPELVEAHPIIHLHSAVLQSDEGDSTVGPTRALVELCPKTYAVQHHAAKCYRFCERDMSTEHGATKQASKRETIRVVAALKRTTESCTPRRTVASQEEGPSSNR
jgi:hypothetical protein